MNIGRLTATSDPVTASREFLAGLIEKSVVKEVLVPAVQPGGNVALALFADPEELRSSALPWAPVMGVQGARALSRIAFTDPGVRVAAVLRPCEARAAVELIKLGQIKPENILFITVDCPGTCELKGFAESKLDPVKTASKLIGQMASGAIVPPAELHFRSSCNICENPSAEFGDIRLNLFGCAGSLEIEAEDKVAADLEKAGLAVFGSSPCPEREKVVAELRTLREKARDELFKAFESEAGSLEGFKKAFSTCIRCLNCMENCPICYCKVCIFKSPLFEHEGSRYAGWAARKGVQKMPSETMLFHMTRLSHMASSCIGCGLCDTACPMGLPVSTLFRKTAARVQSMLGYEAGKSLDEPVPVSTFREDELRAESGAKDH
jgi:formate dehydrogenase subunit beta